MLPGRGDFPVAPIYLDPGAVSLYKDYAGL
jgi:hypothetical protein